MNGSSHWHSPPTALLVAASCTDRRVGEPSASGDPTVAPRRLATPTTTEPPGTTPGSTVAEPGPQGFASANLEFFGDCPALLAYMQTEASERVTAWGFGGGRIYYGDDG